MNLICQIETAAAVENAFEIASTPGVDGVFIGPSDLAASLGLIGRQGHPAVVAHVKRAIEAARRAGTPIGINAFDPVLANAYRDEGIDLFDGHIGSGRDALADVQHKAVTGLQAT